MQDLLDEAILLGTDQMQLQCIKTGDYIIKKDENVGVSGRANDEVDMKLFKVICKPVGEVKILSTKWSEEFKYFLGVNGTQTLQMIGLRSNMLRRLVNGMCFIRLRWS
jgi:hypothetical protein